jgi:hypothetical protein
LTVPEFIMALENIGYATNELRPKNADEIAAEMGKTMTEFYKRNRELRKKMAEATDEFLGGL